MPAGCCRTTARIQTARIRHAAVTRGKRTAAVTCRILTTGNSATHIVVRRTRIRHVAIRTIRMAMMPIVATVPIYMVRTTCPTMPPYGVIAPVPRRGPAGPERVPEPVVDVRTIDINRFYHVVRAIDILITYHLRRHLTRCLIFLHIDRRHVLEYILCQHGLDYHKMLVAVVRLNNAQIVNLTVTIQVKVGKGGIGVVEHRLEFFYILDCAEQCSHRFQVERLAYVL